MALNVKATIKDEIKVTIVPAPVVLCVTCKKNIGLYLGKGKAVDYEGIQISGKCPICNRNWLACIDGVVKIKTIEGFINVT